MNIEEKILLNEIKNKNIKVFEALFHEYYSPLCQFAQGFVFDVYECENLVQDLFVFIWENSERIIIKSSFKAYLYQSVRNRCLNYIRNLQVKDKYNILYIEAMSNIDDFDTIISLEIYDKIHHAINALPERMAEVFKMKYLNNKKYKEIAWELKISENTVKTQLARAKEKLKSSLEEINNLKKIQ